MQPFCGGASAIGFVASITTLPARFAGPACSITVSAALPLTASTAISHHFAASAYVPSATSPFIPFRHACSFSGSRDARITG